MKPCKRILILGATGFLGSRVTHLLLDEGHHITCAVRNVDTAKNRFPQATVISCNFVTDSRGDWQARLSNIDIIINCVGIFYHKDKKIMWALHYETPRAIYIEAEKATVEKIIHISALSIENYPTEYAKSKLALEKTLNSLSIPYVILKPSFIYGSPFRGGMLLLRNLSALPFMVPLPGGGNQKFQPIHVDELAKAIQHLINANCAKSLSLAAVSSELITLKQIMFCLRKWLGLKNACAIHIPLWLIKGMARWGNLISSPTLNRDAITMLELGNYTDKEEALKFQEVTAVKPQEFCAGLNKIPDSLQERSSARLVFIKPLLRISLAFMWIFSAITSAFIYSKPLSYQLLKTASIPSALQPLLLYGASFINILISLSLLINYKTKVNCVIQALVILLYTAIISFKLPHLWWEPFGPVVKNIPILVSILILYTLESD